MNVKLSDLEREHAAKVIAIFSVLIHGWQTSNFHTVDRANKQLKNLGIQVRILGCRPIRTGGNDGK